MDQGAGVAGVVPVDVGAGLLVVGVWVLVVGAPVSNRVGAPVSNGVGAPVGKGVGAPVGTRVGTRVGVVRGLGGAVLVLSSMGPGSGFVGLLLTGVGWEGMPAAGAGRTRK
jgi:hypothetical protein